jgi:carbon-monoxide dehydrogenase small subunit
MPWRRCWSDLDVTRAVIGATGGAPIVLDGAATHAPDLPGLDAIDAQMQRIILGRAMARRPAIGGPGMTAVALTVNGRAVARRFAPAHPSGGLPARTSAADRHASGLRARCLRRLHLADRRRAGAICIAFAAACEGARVQTIEGLEHDPIMTRLRAAFTAEHALAMRLLHTRNAGDRARHRAATAGRRCGPHTPGAGRQPVSLHRVCGIVRAIQRVLREQPRPNSIPQAASTAPPPPLAGEGWGEGSATRPDAKIEPANPANSPQGNPQTRPPTISTDPTITEVLNFALPLGTVWTALQDPALIAQCVPGARLISVAQDELTGELTTSLGPIRAHFAGAARVTYRPDHTGTVEGEGQDLATKTHLRASATFALTAPTPATSELTLTTTYALRGPLAQLGRGPIVRAFAAELADDRRPSARSPAARHRAATATSPAPAAAVVARMLRRWLFGR